MPALAAFGPVRPSAVGAPYVTVPGYGLRGAHVLGYRDGAAVRLTLPVRNDGWLPLTVTSVGLGGGPAPLLVQGSVEGLPLRLRPGQAGAVTVTAVLTNCRYFHEREIQTYAAVELGYRALGRAGSRSVALDRPLLVKSPMLVGCPDRRLDRQADDRADLLRAG